MRLNIDNDWGALIVNRTLLRSLLALVAVAVSASPLAAQQLLPEYDRCMKAAATNYEFDQCSGAEVTRQEQRLAVAWEKASADMKRFGTEASALFLAEQRAWTAFKEASCRFYDTSDNAFGREGTVIQFGYCRAAVISTRVKALDDIIEFLRPK